MKRFTLAVMALCLFAASAFAQSTTGRLVGTVSGPDGVLPGATITVIDDQTKKEKTVQSSGDGAFTVTQLEFGTYTVKITAQGFAGFTATELKIDANREYTLNPTLEVGNVNADVTVVAGADIVNSSNGELSSSVSPRQITDLPLDGRNPLTLITLQAGTATSGVNGTTSINGQRTSFTNITRDGINVNDNFIRQNATDFSPERASSDDTGEFTVTTQNAGAEQGYGAAQVQLVTPRGSSEFHGALFEYNRNSYFAANSYPNNAAGTERPFLNRNQFGGKIGGPFPIPRFGEGGRSVVKGRGFFFFAYERQILPQSQTNTSTVLTEPARNGIFRFIDSTGVTRSVNIFSLPTSGGVGALAPTGINPIIQQRILAGSPLPNTAGGSLTAGNFSLNQAFNDNYDYYTSRTDYDINDKNTISGVYTFKKEITLRPDVTLDSFTAIPPVSQPGINKFLALAWNSSPTSRFTNEARGGFSFPRAVFNRTVDTPSFFLNSSLINEPESRFLNQGRFQHNYNIQDNATFSAGNHSIRFGASGQFFRINPFNAGGTTPTFTLGTSTNSPVLTAASFAGILPAGSTISSTNVTTANNLLGLLGGIISAGTQTFNPSSQTGGFSTVQQQQNFAYNVYSGYVSDQWRVGPHLTLNAGLRYEYYTGLQLRNGLALEPIIANGTDPGTAVLDPNGGFQFIGGNAGGKNKYSKDDKNNFAPVISFAYTPQFKNNFLGSFFGENRTVIRGGYRISYVPDQFLTASRNAGAGNAGLGATANSAVVGGSTLLNARPDAVPGIDPPAAFTLPRSFATLNALATQGNFATIFAINPNLQTGRTQEYSLGIQRELGFQTAIEVRYVGSYSTNLLFGRDLNQVNIRDNGFLADFNRAAANNALTGNPFCTTAGCQPLQIFGASTTAAPSTTARIRVGTGPNVISNATFINNLADGTPGQLAFNILQTNADINSATGQFPILANPNAGAADLIDNGAHYNYNSLQLEFRRRLSKGFAFQANYTFSKNLTNAVGTSQALFDPLLDNANPQLEYARSDFDQTHSFNFNAIYELPFGKNKRFLNEGGVVDKVLGGFQLSTIIRLGSGSPITLVDPRGTLNRTVRSTRNTVNSSLNKNEIKNLFGDFTRDGVRYFINPDVLQITKNSDGSTTSRLVDFPGARFFRVPAGQTGQLERNIVNGPKQFNMDLSLLKNIRFTERYNLQLRAEAFNLTNRNNFLVTDPVVLTPLLNVNSDSFGQLSPGLSTQSQDLGSPRRLQFALRFEF